MHTHGYKETSEVRYYVVYCFFITHYYISIDIVYLLFRLCTSIFLNISQAFSSRTSRASDAREKDCAGGTRLIGIWRGWCRLTVTSRIVINKVIYEWMLGGTGARPRLGARSRP
jgi:hypothetical protein